MYGEFDFSKGQIPTNSPSKPGRGEVGDNIDRCITGCSTHYVAGCAKCTGIDLNSRKKVMSFQSQKNGKAISSTGSQLIVSKVRAGIMSHFTQKHFNFLIRQF